MCPARDISIIPTKDEKTVKRLTAEMTRPPKPCLVPKERLKNNFHISRELLESSMGPRPVSLAIKPPRAGGAGGPCYDQPKLFLSRPLGQTTASHRSHPAQKYLLPTARSDTLTICTSQVDVIDGALYRSGVRRGRIQMIRSCLSCYSIHLHSRYF